MKNKDWFKDALTHYKLTGDRCGPKIVLGRCFHVGQLWSSLDGKDVVLIGVLRTQEYDGREAITWHRQGGNFFHMANSSYESFLEQFPILIADPVEEQAHSVDDQHIH